MVGPDRQSEVSDYEARRWGESEEVVKRRWTVVFPVARDEEDSEARTSPLPRLNEEKRHEGEGRRSVW